ncbi:MAG: glycoside hydrolase family 3 C-terminal domain-containing protein [Chthoniobacterales bacterium]|nr:glycoside hydrolase family 3 C-terminal domain-containing protein [Chthoniobacterales bacterium]
MTAPLYKDPQRPVSERVADLLPRMTLREKIAQMSAQWLELDPDGHHRMREEKNTPRSEGPGLKEVLAHGVGQVTRPLGTRRIAAREGVRALNALQKFLVEETRLGIPALAHEECLVGLMAAGATLFPSPLNYGATWNPELIEAVAGEIRREALQVGCRVGLAPVLDVSRDVRWGRTEETLGEDPYLTGVLATRFVRGLQGGNRELLATLKHFAAHSVSEGGRNHAPVHLGVRELRDVFLLPFEMAVKQARPGCVMPAYHDIDGEPCHSSHFLLTEVLRNEWGFDGLVIADYGGVTLLHLHHAVARDKAEAAALAFQAGLDQELPGCDCSEHLEDGLARGLIHAEKIDEIVARILTEKFRLGLFEHPYTDETRIALQGESARRTAKEVARQSVVLVENRGLLPLDAAAGKTLAVIGPLADDPLALFSGYSFPVHLIAADGHEAQDRAGKTLVQALTETFGAACVRHARGCDLLTARCAGAPVFPGDVDAGTGGGQAMPLSDDVSRIPEAVALARASDVAVVAVGDLAGLFQTGTVGEGSDTDNLGLPGVQEELLRQVLATGTPTLVVMLSGRPYSLNGLEERAAAVVMAFQPGQEGAEALAEVLCGAVSPSGRLVVSIPKSAGAVPCHYNHKLKSGGSPLAAHFGSRYGFGHGLTYTRFAYRDLVLANRAVPGCGEVEFSLRIVNVGDREGCEVVQVYVRDRFASLVRPVKELKAFQRVTLEPGQSAEVRFSIPVDMLGFSTLENRQVVEAGDFDLLVGASSADIRCRATFTVTDDHVPGRDWRMESTSEVKRILPTP